MRTIDMWGIFTSAISLGSPLCHFVNTIQYEIGKKLYCSEYCCNSNNYMDYSKLKNGGVELFLFTIIKQRKNISNKILVFKKREPYKVEMSGFLEKQSTRLSTRCSKDY